MKTEIHKCRATSRVITLLTAIAEMIGQLEGVKLQKPNPTLRHKHRIQIIQSSLSIEGNSLTRDQVTALFDNKRVIDPRKEILDVQNAILAYKQVGAFNPLSIASLRKAHGIFMEGLVPFAGAFRREPIGVLRPEGIFHEAQKWKHVEPMMQTLFAYLKTTDDHWLLKLCRFHFQLEHIHPFVDGNGRMGRLWQTRLLMEYHPIFEFLPVEDLIKERQNAYYGELATGDDTDDCTGFVVLMLTLIRESLEKLLTATRSVTPTAADRLELATQSFGDNSFSRKDYQALFKTISTATASRDLQQGVKVKILERRGNKRTAVYRIKKIALRS